ncbi:MAG: hypothetical protein LUG52_01415 [Clostridia bacterium]|nr:hypothetical protein [Clostridia bacterium]
MRLSEVKNIIILLLVVLNVFLLVNTVIADFGEYALPEGFCDSAESVLQKNGITIEKSLLPTRYESRMQIEVDFYGIDDLSQLLLKQTGSYTSAGGSVVAEKGDEHLSVAGREFVYTTGRSGERASGGRTISALKKLGFDTENMVYDNDDDFVKIKIDGAVAAGMYMNVLLDEDGNVAEITGRWAKISKTGEKVKTTFVSCLPEICEKLPEGAHIVGIDEIYIIDERSDEASIGWRITTEDGSSYDVG